ncbi:MAG TPA: FtsX-like permease family protein [Acidimicrobiales bacterium]|nr:FtsX-like permease family protein [Acidimicrobiales bacterium]
MIRLGLRLTVGGGKEAAARLVATAAGVAVGVGLLLVTLSGMNAINAQNARTAWLNTGVLGRGPALDRHGPVPQAGPAAASTDPLWWQFSLDYFGGKSIDRVDVAPTGAASPVPPGIAHLPGPGQFYASPALSRLLAATPADELATRFPGTQIGTIGRSALPSPGSLVVVVGDTPAQLSTKPAASEVDSINTETGLSGPAGLASSKLQVILAVGALALLFPVLVFIGTATRLAAARREQRFAAMRLVGATPRQVAVISAVESCVAAVCGVAAGFGVFFLLRPFLSHIAFTGAPLASGDLSLSLTDVALVALGVPLAAVAAARFAMRRVQISPLGVSRRVRPAPPRPYRLLPLVAGVAELLYFVVVGQPQSTGAQIDAYFSGCFLVLVGLVMAGPWLTMAGARFMVRRTGRPSVLIAGRRLSDNPKGAFRAISGLIIALFATSVSIGIITTILDYQNLNDGTVARTTLVEQFESSLAPSGGHNGQLTGNPDQLGLPVVPATLVAQLRAIPGVAGVTVAYADTQQRAQDGSPVGLLVSCAQLAQTPGVGRCRPGATLALIPGGVNVSEVGSRHQRTPQETTWQPPTSISLSQLASFPVGGLVVEASTSASSAATMAAVERARTLLEATLPSQHVATMAEVSSQSLRQIVELQQMTDVVIVVSLVIAGCSLAVSVTGGVSERKRPFSLLRLTGVPVRALRRVVELEAAVPLLVISAVAAGMGFLTAGLFLNSQLSETLQAPRLSYYLIVGTGLVISLVIIAATFPIIERITGPEIARNE